MLREIANGEAYPGNDEFPTYESWKTFCCDLANKFEMVQQERWEDGGYNEYEEEWEKTLEPRNPNLTTTTDMTEEEKQNRPKVTKALLVRVFSYLKPYWKQFLLILCAIAASSLLALYPSVLTGRIVDALAEKKGVGILVRLILLSRARR